MIFTTFQTEFDDAPKLQDTGNLMKIVIFTSFQTQIDDAAELQAAGILMKIVIFTTFHTEFDDAPESKDRQSDENRNFYHG